MTDVMGSTRLWEEDPAAMDRAMRRHDELIQNVANEFLGSAPKGRGEGDSAFVVFPTVALACEAAHSIQIRLRSISDESGHQVKVRAAIHIGEAIERDRDYYGPTVNRCARIRAVAHGGQILLSEAAARQAREAMQPPYGFQELGNVRLKDLLEPEHIHQLTHPDLESGFARLLSLDFAPNNLPPQITSFLGRASDLAETRRLLGERRQVTLLGAGGSGKTRLAIQAAAEMATEHSEGAWFVDLASLPAGSEIHEVFQRTLHLDGTATAEPLVEALSAMQCLLVVDNCEHVVESARRVCAAILKSAPGVHLLVTSRQALAYEGEQTRMVEGLSLPPIDSRDPGEVAVSEAVRLLVERAQLKTSDFMVTDENAPWLAKIVHRLDGLPLALELAASRLHLMSAEELFGRLTDLFKGLGRGPADSVPRHRTIEAAIEWSFGLLSDEERKLFLTLALLPGGWTLSTAEDLHERLGLKPEPMTLIEGLVDKSMIIPGPNLVGSHMRMLVPVREYGLRLLGKDGEISRDAALAWATAVSANAWKNPDEGMIFAQAEAANLRAAVEIAIERKDFDASVALLKPLFRLWMLRGQLAEGRAVVERAMTFANAGDPDGCGFLHNFRGVFAWAQKDLGVAEDSIRKAISLWTIAANKPKLPGAYNNLGLILASGEQWEDARTELETAHQMFTDLGDEAHVAEAAANLGNLLKEQGKMAEARPFLEDSLRIARVRGDMVAIETANGILAEIAVAEGDWATARTRLVEALQIAVEQNDVVRVAQGLITAARIRFELNEVASSIQMLGAAESAFGETSYRPTAQSAQRQQALSERLSQNCGNDEILANRAVGRIRGAIALAGDILEGRAKLI